MKIQIFHREENNARYPDELLAFADVNRYRNVVGKMPLSFATLAHVMYTKVS